MTNVFKMMKEAANMQRGMKKIQDKLREKTVEHTAADGKIKITARADASISAIKIDPSLLKPELAGELEKLLIDAIEGALEAAKNAAASDMQQLMKDMGLPNMPGLM
jgi:DNA-binding YbaB/EbfC family protein